MDLNKFAKLTEEEQEEAAMLLEDLRTIECKDDYFTFFKDAWKVIEPGTKLKPSPHIKYLCDILGEQIKKIANGDPADYDKIFINVPPSMSKSTIGSKILPPWVWLQNPTLKLITSSFDDGLATDHTVKSRDIITSEWFQERWGHLFQLKTDQNEKKRYYNDKTGIRKAVTTKGGKTGFHCHVYIQDDPIDPHKSLSEAERATAIRDHDQVIPSRVLEGGLRIIIMQRLHELDPTGHELNKIKKGTSKDRVLHVCLPATQSQNVKPQNANSLYVDGLLDPSRLDEERLAKFKENLGSYGYSGQYLQLPFPEGGGKIKKEWFQHVHEKEVPSLTWDLWIDGAYTKNTENDPTGLVAKAYDERNKRLYIKHATSKHMEIPELMGFIPEYAELMGLDSKSKIFVEPKATGLTLVQLINSETHYSAIKIKNHLVQEGKEARIQTAAPKYEAGKVYHVIGSWTDDYEGQLLGFPTAAHDEYVDLIGYACKHYFTGVRSRISRRA